LKYFNNKRFDNVVRAHACELALELFDYHYDDFEKKVKSFNPIKFLNYILQRTKGV